MKNRISILMAVTFCMLVFSGTAWAVEYSDNMGCYSETGSNCHGPLHNDKVTWLQNSAHVNSVTGVPFACETCHEGAANHKGDMSNKTTVHFDLEVCGGCHPDQFGTYTYGDDWKTQFGGSPGPDAVMPLPNGYPGLWDKLDDFGNYNDIIDGYGFTREYNEERSHNVMIKDHHDVTRGKKDTCLQCKSTKLAYYWDTGQVRVILNAVTVDAGHMAEPITVPKGTMVSMYTNRPDPGQPPALDDFETRVLVTLPNGTMYASFNTPGAITGAATGNWLWSALYALTVNELPTNSPTIDSGNGCNHCHDPHRAGNVDGRTTGFRLIRKSLLYAIENQGGINPYDPSNTDPFDGITKGLTMDEGIALCAQCHVEYVCGNSPIDKVDRDFFSWAKAADLESVYEARFPGWGVHADKKYVQDWVHGTGGLSSPSSPGNGVYYLDPNPIQEELIKSQHPEAETYWESRHYGNDAACFSCHMPKVTKISDGSTFTSHWLASPNKYMTPEPVQAFAAQFGLELNREGIIPPCGTCHGGKLSRMKTKAERIQSDIYDDALAVQAALMESLSAIKAAKDAGGTTALIDAAAEDHRAAHVRWENLVVSENSMGFHNPSEISTELHNALALAQSARQNAEDALGGAVCTPDEPVEVTCDDLSDNDCDGFIDCADSDCDEDPACLVAACSSFTEQTPCEDQGCKWIKKKGGSCVDP